jgi:hypothetical protein
MVKAKGKDIKEPVGKRVRETAVSLLKNKKNGMRWTDLLKAIKTLYPDTPLNTISGSLWDLVKTTNGTIKKPARGVFIYRKFVEKAGPEDGETIPKVKTSKGEEAFYGKVADYLMNELEECTKAISLGGNVLKSKWGTPDVIGIRESKQTDIIKAPTEIISAEVKTDEEQLITAFGQACAYKLFSHRSYIFIPKGSPEEGRLEALCSILGIGLILFNNQDPESPEFEIKVRAAKHDPDMFFVNENLEPIKKQLWG